MMIRILTIVVCLAAAVLPASAQVRVEGTATATRDCPATRAIKDKSADVILKVGESYVLQGKNKDEATHYWIKVPGASHEMRWVEASCLGFGGTAAAQPTGQPAKPARTSNAFHILAVSWQPAFCETRPGKPECRSQTENRFDASHFTLHGLWPQPRSNVFCGVTADEREASENGQWQDLDPVQLSDDVRNELESVMPGSQSQLDRHEWIKHGTCYQPRDSEAYYRDSLRLMRELNATAGQAFMAENVGRRIRADELRARFDETLGAGAGDRMRFVCTDDGNRRLLVEITIGLRGDIPAGTPLKDLIAASSPTDPGCPSFIVDPVGLQ